MNEPFQKGYRQADLLAAKEPNAVAYWLHRARRSRRRWRTRFFNGKKRRFLDGFIARLEASLKDSGRDPAAASPLPQDIAPAGTDIEFGVSGSWPDPAPEDRDESLRA